MSVLRDSRQQQKNMAAFSDEVTAFTSHVVSAHYDPVAQQCQVFGQRIP